MSYCSFSKGDISLYLRLPRKWRLDKASSQTDILSQKICPCDICRENHVCGMCRKTTWYIILLFFVLYLIAIFLQSIEGPLEIERNIKYVTFMNEIQQKLNLKQWNALQQYLPSDPTTGSTNFITHLPPVVSSVSLSNITTDASAWTMNQHPLKGGLSNVIFFIFTLATTVGYGDFAPLSNGGKILSMFTILFTVPVTM